MSPRRSRGWVLITRISYECTWVITGLLPKRFYQSMLSLWPVSNGFRSCSPIKASFGTNNIFLWFFSLVISTYPPRTDIYLSVLWLVISDISHYKTLWSMASLGNKYVYPCKSARYHPKSEVKLRMWVIAKILHEGSGI